MDEKKRNDFQMYISKIENYTIRVGYGSKGYVVTFMLKRSNEYPAGFMGDGGLTEYVIDPVTFQITEMPAIYK